MSFKATHELHRRRLGRNVGLGLVLAAFVALVFGLSMVKIAALIRESAQHEAES